MHWIIWDFFMLWKNCISFFLWNTINLRQLLWKTKDWVQIKKNKLTTRLTPTCPLLGYLALETFQKERKHLAGRIYFTDQLENVSHITSHIVFGFPNLTEAKDVSKAWHSCMKCWQSGGKRNELIKCKTNILLRPSMGWSKMHPGQWGDSRCRPSVQTVVGDSPWLC